MNSIKYFTNLLLKYILMLLIFFTFIIVFIYIASNYNINKYEKEPTRPQSIYELLLVNNNIELNSQSEEILNKNNIWFMLLTEDGNIIRKFNLPKELNKQYSTKDIVLFTRWYLEDYPVFTYIAGDNILVIGYPKDKYVKIAYSFYDINLLKSSIKLAFITIIIAISLLFLIYYYSKKRLIAEIRPITESIKELSENEYIQLPEKGSLLEIKKALNKTSKTMKDSTEQRAFWIRGISHDLRTPLTLITGYSHLLEEKLGKSKELEIIERNALLMENIIMGLNLTYLLEDPTLKMNIKKINMQQLLRNIVVDFINTSSENFEFYFKFQEEEIFLEGDAQLIDRAFRNIIQNSTIHNKSAKIHISLIKRNGNIIVIIEDNGSINSKKVGTLLSESRKNNHLHGLGVIITKKIVELHKGAIEFQYNNPGLKCIIKL